MNIILQPFIDNNLGDDLMIKLFAKKFKQHKIIILSDDTLFNSGFKEEKNIIFYSPNMYEDVFKIADIHIIIGGSMFILKIQSIKDAVKLRYRYFESKKLKKIAKKNNIKTAVIGANLGPFDKNNYGLMLAKYELNTKDFITVRDKYSYQTLYYSNCVNISNNVTEYPDIVYGLRKYLPSDEINKKYGLGISAYRSTNKKQNYENYLAYAKISDEFISKTGKKVAIFSFDSEDQNDLISAYYIKEFSEYPEMIEIVPYLRNIELFLEKFSLCENFLATRFHSAILSQVYDIPFYALGYSNKMKNLMNDQNKLSYFSELKNLNKDLNKISEKILSGDLARCDNIEELSRRSQGHFKKIEILINSIKDTKGQIL